MYYYSEIILSNVHEWTDTDEAAKGFLFKV